MIIYTIISLFLFISQIYSIGQDSTSPPKVSQNLLNRRSRSVPNLRQHDSNHKHENVLGLYSRYPQMQSHRNEESGNVLKTRKLPQFMLKIDEAPKSPPADVSKVEVLVKTHAPSHRSAINYSRPLPSKTLSTPRHRLIDESVTAYILQDYLRPDIIQEENEERDENTRNRL